MINIFARPTYMGNRYRAKEDSLQRISTRVRGEEIAEYLGARLNPKKVDADDVCIHVKPYSLNEVRDGDWVDYLDGFHAQELLGERPKVNIIAASQNSYEWLKDNCPNRIKLIPQHHINIDNLKRKRNKKLVGGYTGGASREAERIYNEVAGRFNELGLTFKTCFNFKTREDSIAFYQGIDVLVIADFSPDTNPHKIPTKIINAASFGVPTIAYPLSGYKEVEGYYAKTFNLNELMMIVEVFKDNDYYQKISSQAKVMAENYHISKIAELYEEL